VILRNFITTELKEDPLSLLGEETWQAMLEVSEVYEAERKECVDLLAAVDWGSDALAESIMGLTCSACSGSLLRPEDGQTSYNYDMALQCRICGELRSPESYVPEAIANALSSSAYASMKDGGETAYTTCPECNADAYIMEGQRCALCGESAVHTCERCGNDIPAEELMCSPLCGYCAYTTAKDD